MLKPTEKQNKSQKFIIFDNAIHNYIATLEQ